MQKSCAGSYVMLDPRLHLAATLGLYAMLLVGWAAVRLARIQLIRPQRNFNWLIATLTPISAVLFFVKIHAKDLGIRSCSFSSPSHLITLTVDFFFFLRPLVEVLEGHMPEPIPSLNDCWLLVNTIWKMTHKVVISEYHFLVLLRFLYPQTLEMYTLLLTRLFGVWVKEKLFQLSCIIVGVFLFAGALQTAEEWSQLLGIHPDADGQVTALHTYWDYIYMGYITVSTVGYGDMTPSTTASQAIVVIAIVGYIAWYSSNCEELFQVARGIIFNIAGHLPPLPRHRRLVVVGCLETEKMHLLVDQLAAQGTQIIVGIGREESLSVQQIPGVFVISTDLNRSFFKRCFPEHLKNPTVRSSDTLMILNQQGEGDEVGARASDLHVLSLVQLVKGEIPDLAIVAQVWRSESRITVENIEGWNRVMDQVVCHEELMAGLMTQAVAAHGAASILATLITSPVSTNPPKIIHTCTDKITHAHLWGQGLVLAISDSKCPEEESFQQAVLHSYLLNRILLLGYVEDEGSGDTWIKQCHILPTFFPPDARRIVIAPQDLVTTEGSVVTPATHHSGKTIRSLSELRPLNVLLQKTKTVRVVRDGPAGCVTKGLSRPYLRVLKDEDEEAHCDVAVMLEPQDGSGQALYNYYCSKADLAKTSQWTRLVSNVEHGMSPGMCKVSGGYPHACVSFVNPRVVTSAVCLAYHSYFLFRLWSFLVQDCHLVELEVNGYYCYGKIFSFLLTYRRMLAIGATIQLSSHSRSACCKALLLDPKDKGSLAVTNPDFDFCLHPGDKVVAFPFEEELLSA